MALTNEVREAHADACRELGDNSQSLSVGLMADCHAYVWILLNDIQGDELKECETRSVHGTELRRQHITKHAHAHNREHICSSQTATYRIA